MFGWGYASDTCVSLFNKEQTEKAVRNYYAECMRIMTENIARACGGPYIDAKLQDIIEPRRSSSAKPGDIISRIRNKLKSG